MRSLILRTMLVAAMGVACASNAAAQADPLEFLKKYPSTTASVGSPNVIVAVDLANRMQRGAPSDANCLPSAATPNSCTTAVANATSNYYDSFLYTRATNGNSGPVNDADTLQQGAGITTDSNDGKWKISRPLVNANNGAQGQPAANSLAIVQADSSTANSDLESVLSRDLRQTDGNSASTHTLLPAGNDDANTIEAPVNNLLIDARDEAKRLIAINNDPTCRSTIVILIVGGGEGNTSGGGITNATLAATATGFLNVNNSGRRVPIYVIAIAPPGADRSSLQAIATNSGGQYFEITKQMIDLAFLLQSTVYPSSVTGTLVVPEVVAAMNAAVMHSYAASTDFNAGTASEFPMTAPITGTVDLTNGHDINGHALLNSEVHNTKSGALIPQRGNVLVTTAVTTPTTNGLGGVLRAFRTYIPKSDSTQLSGWQFVSQLSASDPGGPQEKRLWVACVPGPGCATPTGTSVTDSSLRNLYTVTPDGTM